MLDIFVQYATFLMMIILKRVIIIVKAVACAEPEGKTIHFTAIRVNAALVSVAKQVTNVTRLS